MDLLMTVACGLFVAQTTKLEPCEVGYLAADGMACAYLIEKKREEASGYSIVEYRTPGGEEPECRDGERLLMRTDDLRRRRISAHDPQAERIHLRGVLERLGELPGRAVEGER